MTNLSSGSGRRTLWSKFRCAFRGLRRAVALESNFLIHGLAALAVVILAAVLGVSSGEWCLLALCIASVMAAEIFNTAIEMLAKRITDAHHPYIQDALDLASAAVLVTAIGALLVGLIIFVPRLLALLGA